MIVVQFLLLALGFLMLIKGSDFFVDGAVGIAKRFGIPQLIIGLTIVAMGTSAPEAAVSIASGLKGNADLSVGNILGSNILNILIILGISSVIVTIAVSKSTIKYELPFLLGISVVFILLGLDKVISKVDAIILIALFVFYMVYLFIVARKNKETEDPEVAKIKQRPMYATIILTAIGVALIVGGSQVTVNAATNVALAFGLSDRIIGLTVVAFGTSLPELFTSVTAARKGNADIAIGNIVGSNIFNILFIIGITGLILDIPFQPSFIIDGIVSIGATILLWLLCFRKQKLKRVGGVILLAGYAAYFIYMILS